jgi:hypothetical protein
MNGSVYIFPLYPHQISSLWYVTLVDGAPPCLDLLKELPPPNNTWLVHLTILKNMSSSMGRMTSHLLWEKMFETTNQILSLTIINHY